MSFIIQFYYRKLKNNTKVNKFNNYLFFLLKKNF